VPNGKTAVLSCLILFLTLFLVAHAAAPAETSIVDFGAVGDGKTVNTKSIQAAIDHVAAAGGGLLIVPKGTFMSGALFFKQGVNLRVEKDGVLKGTTVQADYPLVKTRWEGVEGMHTSAFINFTDMTHVTVDGEGMIDGSGDAFPRGRRRGGAGGGVAGGGGGASGGGAGRDANDQTPNGQTPATRPARQSAGATTRFVFQQVGRPRLICFQNCQDIHISDLHLQKQAIWCLHLLYSRDVVVDNITIRSTIYIPSSDGIDVDSCDRVLIKKCDIACTDDDIAIKSGKDDDGRRVNRPSQNITIQDCTMGTGDGIAMGSEVTGSVRHVLVERCTFNGTSHCARIKSEPSRGGEISEIVFRDITLKDAGEAFDFELSWNMRLERAAASSTLTLCHDVQLINFTGTSRAVGTVIGYATQPISDVKFVNCRIAAERGLRMLYATNVDTSGLNTKVQQGPAIITGAAAASQPFKLPT